MNLTKSNLEEMNSLLGEGERLEDLECNNLKIIQNKNLYCFTSDSVILANFLKIKKNETAVEIGGGCGVVSILASAKNKFKKIKIFEIQKEMQALCQKNINLNNLQEKLKLIPDDVLNFKKYVEKNVDVVFSNPPYFKVSDTKENIVKKIAKQEVKLTLNTFVEVASKMLKFGGRFYCSYPAERTCELISTCHKFNIAIKKMFFTDNGKGKTTLIFVEGVKGGKEGVLVLPMLTTNNQNGEFLEELKTRKFLENKK